MAASRRFVDLRRVSLGLLLLGLGACNRPEGIWGVARIDGRSASPGQIPVRFADGEMSAKPDCNTLRARYVAFADHIWWLSPVKTTLAICLGRTGAYGGGISNHLEHTTAYHLRDGEMVLQGSAGELTLRRR